jgi:geranylgeranyl diphosphate synthase, type II
MPLNLSQIVKKINTEISKHDFGTEPKELYDPIHYILESGGKRLRPLLTIWGNFLFSDEVDKAIKPAIGIEAFHNFTLMHDDIMDNAPMRRGKPSVHTKWNSNIAILSGDVMLVKSYDFLLNVDGKIVKEVISSFNDCASKVCEGQQSDMNFESVETVKEMEYLKMIENKTAVLLGFSLKLGGLIGGADEKSVRLLEEGGKNIGIAFQLKDDLLDVYGKEESFGKKVGGDIVANKKTFLLIKALEKSQGADKKKLLGVIKDDKISNEQKVKQITEIYDKLEINKITEQKIDEYFKAGLKNFSGINAPMYKKKMLCDFIKELTKREN